MFFRIKPAKQYRYLQIVQSVRKDNKVRQEVIATLGRMDILQQSGQLEKLLHSGLRHCKEIKVLRAHSEGETKPVAIRKIGPNLVFGRLWNETGIKEILNKLTKKRRHDFDLERVIYLTVLHRLFCSGSDRSAERWKELYHIPGSEELSLQHLYRAMAWLGEHQEKEDKVIKSTKNSIEEALFTKNRDLFSQTSLVLFDTTSIYFHGKGGESLGQRGHSKDRRGDCHQIVVGLVVDNTGRPICCEIWPGNTADVTTMAKIIERLRTKFHICEICIAADRGMVSQEVLKTLEEMTPAVKYIVGMRIRRTKEVGEIVLTNKDPWTEITPEREYSTDPSPLKIKEVKVAENRYIVCLNEEERRKDAHDRSSIVASLQKQLRGGDKKLVSNKGYRRFLKVEDKKKHFAIDEKRVSHDALYDGIFVLRTNTNYDAKRVALSYKMLWMVEECFRTSKSILETRPIYHKRDETIRGHVFCSFLALVLKRELEIRMKEKNLHWEWAELIRGLDNLQEVEAELCGQRFLLRGQITGHASQAIRGAQVAIPPTLRQIS